MASKTAVLKIQNTFSVNKIYAKRVLSRTHSKNYIEEAQKIISEKPKPFIKWVGGKRQLPQQFRLMNLYPPDKFNPIKNKYFEPFVGGGAVFFDLLPKKAYLSDLNMELVTTYNVIKNDVDGLIKSLKKHRYQKEYFLQVRSQDPKKLSEIDTLDWKYINNRLKKL